MAIRIPITFSAKEQRDINKKRLAKKPAMSFSNYVRQLVGLPLLKHGDPRRFKSKKAAEQPEVNNEN